MKLLFDENLSQRLVARLADIFPGSSHVSAEGVGGRDDELVWAYAAQHGFAIVSKDEDFHHLAFLRGAPPKVIGVLLGNCTTDEIAALLWARQTEIRAFINDPGSAYLALGRA